MREYLVRIKISRLQASVDKPCLMIVEEKNIKGQEIKNEKSNRDEKALIW